MKTIAVDHRWSIQSDLLMIDFHLRSDTTHPKPASS